MGSLITRGVIDINNSMIASLIRSDIGVLNTSYCTIL